MSVDTTPLVFECIEPTDIPVTIKTKDGPRNYILKEASEGDRVAWQNKLFSSTTIGKDGTPSGVGNVADAEPLLVSRCIVEIVTDQKGTREVPVEIQVIRGWPARIVKKLYEKIMEVNGFGDNDSLEEVEKKIQKLQERAEVLRGQRMDPTKGQ